MIKSKQLGVLFFTAVALMFGGKSAWGKDAIKVACVGDSITAGVFLGNPGYESYPAQLGRMLGGGYNVLNFGNSGSTLGNMGDKPYKSDACFASVIRCKPNVVVIMLGTNDTKENNWAHKDSFVADYKDLINQFKKAEPQPKIFVCTPPAIFCTDKLGPNETNVREACKMINDFVQAEKIPLIDTHKATMNQEKLFPDKLHPNAEGAAILAKTVYKSMLGKPFQGNIPDTLDSTWNGLTMREFHVSGRPCRLVFPEHALPGNPWIWRTEFFDAYPAVDVALAKAGYHVAYMNVSGMFGAPKALVLMDAFYEKLTSTYRLNSKTVLEGFSRGGLFAVNWAAKHPDRVASLYLDAPVCDFKSWPAGKGKGNASVSEWSECLRAYGMTEAQALAYKGNPVDNLNPLATAHIPILSVYGDADKTVIPEENILLLEQRYTKLGGKITLIRKIGVDHHPHSLDDPKPVVDFIIANQK